MSVLADTIFARATGAGRAAVTVIRLSGPRTGEILGKLGGRLPRPRMATLRRLVVPTSGEPIDDALVLWFPGPKSYTGEDAAELHLHGGPAVLAAAADALASIGCRPAEPGEFTRRAFLNGKLDLLQAEAVADLIEAETAAQHRQALRQAEGALSRLYAGWTARLTKVLAQAEAAIEFQMDDLPSDVADRARDAAARLADEIASHLADGGRGERLRDGLSIAILGAPNAGKSSLLNALVGRPAAIVSAQAGTTRDVIECRLDLGGIPAMVADTAGLRDVVDEVEGEGVRRARTRATEADLVVAVFAADQVPDPETLGVLADRPDAVVVASKCDLAEPPSRLIEQTIIRTSVESGTGLDELRSVLTREAERRAGLTETPALTRARHRAALAEALTMLEEAVQARLPEIAAESYRSSLRVLGRLTGRVNIESVLDAVFSEFCIGK